MNWIKNLGLICISSLLPVIVFLIIDLLIGLSRLEYDPKNCRACQKNEPLGNGWYELKPNYDEQVFFVRGKISYRVTTDKNRFRVSGNDSECSVTCTDLLFLGDSYTFGVNGDWEDTFVGMVQKDSPGLNVINGGNESYSVTPYNYVYRRYLRTRDSESAHLVVIAVDLSDVQDEAGNWRAGPDHPERFQWWLGRNRTYVNNKSWRKEKHPLKAYLPYTHSIWGYFKFAILKSDSYLEDRVAFTYRDWQSLEKSYPSYGYLPLGVSGGIAKVKSGLKELLREIEKHNGEAIFLIYPWPNQLVFEDSHFDWSQFIRTICEEGSCAGVIDLFPAMRGYKQVHPTNWYTNLYVTGDSHFNVRGNRMIAEHVLRFLDAKNSDVENSPSGD